MLRTISRHPADVLVYAGAIAFGVAAFVGAVPFSLLEALGFATGAASVWLVVRASVWTWPVGIANNVQTIPAETRAEWIRTTFPAHLDDLEPHVRAAPTSSSASASSAPSRRGRRPSLGCLQRDTGRPGSPSTGASTASCTARSSGTLDDRRVPLHRRRASLGGDGHGLQAPLRPVGAPWIELRGSAEQRLARAVAAVDELLAAEGVA